MKPICFFLSGLILAGSLAAATAWEDDRTRLHLAGDFRGKAWFAELTMQPNSARLSAQLRDGSWQGDLEGTLRDRDIVFRASNEMIFPGTITAPLPASGGQDLTAVWTYKTRQIAIPARVIARERLVRSVKEGVHEASCAWPELTGYNSLANSLVTTTVSNFALSNHSAFLKLSADPDERDGNSRLWAHHLGYETRMVSDRFFSIRFHCYTYTGGAHPGRWSHSWNFAISGESARHIPLASIIRSGQIEPLVTLVQKTLAAKGAGWPLEVNSTHLENYVITPLGIEFHFDPYIAGCYAEGDYVVFMKWDELDQYILPGIR